MSRCCRAAIILGMLFALSPARAGQPAETPAKLPLKVSADHRYLVDQTDRPFLYNADTAWMIFLKLTEAEASEYLARRKAQGFNAVQVQLTGFAGMLNRAGEKPFVDDDFARPNEAFFSHVDRIVARAEELNLVLAIAPLWAGCCGEGWAGRDKAGKLKPVKANGPEKCFAFGKYLGARYARFRNVMWIMGGDNDPHAEREEYRQLALGIKAAAPTHLITYHAASSHSSSDVYPKEPWLDVVMIYTYFRGFNKAWNKNQPDVYEAGYTEYAKKPVKPFFLGESTYEGEHGAWGSDLQARKNAYWAVLSGGTGHAYGSPNWNFPPEWRRIIGLPGAGSLKHFHALFCSRPWHTLAPDVKNELAVAGVGNVASNDYATTAIAADGSFSITYLPSSRKITIDLGKLSAERVRAWWFDPSTGQVEEIAEMDASGRHEFEPAGEGDWVLVLDDVARRYPPPGQVAARAAE